jgi:cation diffusion facilitator family transporter
VKADAWHHMSDALTSAAAFVGISIAVVGGPGWESADDWAALFASCIIAFNGISMVRPAIADLMDRTPGLEITERVRHAAEAVEGAQAVEKLAVRKTGLTYRADLHVQADPMMPLHEAHVLSGKVKGAIRAAVPQVDSVLVHMEPFESGARPPGERGNNN